MDRFKVGELKVDARAPVMLEGSKSPHFHTILKGAAVREKTLPDGRRQVVNFAFPGDLVGLQAGLLGEMKHSVHAATDMVLCVFERERLWELFRKNPERAYDVTWLAATEERALGDALLTVGRRSGRERIAYLLAFLMRRGIESGFSETKSRMRFPFRQQDLADAVGITPIYANRMLQSLRKAGVIRLADGELEVKRADALNVAAMSAREPEDGGRPLL